MSKNCSLCVSNPHIIWEDDVISVIFADELDYPGFCRVIWKRHVAEMTELREAERAWLMEVVWAVERVQRAVLQPTKVNLASLGNMVPHVHWHVIPRFSDDPHFPQAPWGTPLREVDNASLASRAALLPALKKALIEALDQLDF